MLSSRRNTRAPYYTAAHNDLRDRVCRFAQEEIEPYANQWEEAGTFPRELYLKAGAAGVLGAGFPARYGGDDGDIFCKIIVKEELARVGPGGVRASLLSHGIGLPPIINLGSDALREAIAPPVLAGEKIICLAITEPAGGSDVANLGTTAERVGGYYVVNGEKKFITSGMRADYITLAVRTGGSGLHGISLLIVDAASDGIERVPLKKTGWWTSDTALISFRNVKVPVENLIGEENQGFKGIMLNFNEERLGNTAIVLGAVKACFEESVTYAKSRKAFNRFISDNQVIRHMLVDMATKIQAVETCLDTVAWRFERGERVAADVAMLKNLATETYEFCANKAVQIHGGAGVLRENKVDRLFRESKILSIGGGSVEVLKDLVARQLDI